MSESTPVSIRVGTASWSEPEFVRAGWYPPGLAAGKQLQYYAHHFDLVELNSSFYAMPTPRMCAKWVEETPNGFLFDVKCFRLLSRHATKADALPPDLRETVEQTDRGNVVLTPLLEGRTRGPTSRRTRSDATCGQTRRTAATDDA